MGIRKTLLTTALVLAFGQSQATMVWQPLPKPKPPQGEHAGHGAGQQGQQGQGQNPAPHRSGGKPFKLTDSEGAQANIWAPTLAQTPLKLEEGKTKASSRGVDNYHALVAVKESDARVDAALRYIYMRGKPSGESPSKLTAADKVALEIVPDPLPREHWRYQSLNPANFIIKWQGQPLANHEIRLTTANGTQTSMVSDDQGVINFILPDDFEEIKPGRRNNKPAEFVLSTSFQQGDKHYQTTLSAPYSVSPSHWQSNQLALLTMAVGFIGGLGLVRLIPRPKRRRRI